MRNEQVNIRRQRCLLFSRTLLTPYNKFNNMELFFKSLLGFLTYYKWDVFLCFPPTCVVYRPHALEFKRHAQCVWWQVLHGVTHSLLKNSEGVSPSVCKASFCTFVTSGALGNTDCWTSVGTSCSRSRAMEHTFLMSALQWLF